MGSMALRLEGHQPGTARKPPPARCATTSHLYTVTPVTSSAIPAGSWVQTQLPLCFGDLCEKALCVMKKKKKRLSEVWHGMTMLAVMASAAQLPGLDLQSFRV